MNIRQNLNCEELQLEHSIPVCGLFDFNIRLISYVLKFREKKR